VYYQFKWTHRRPSYITARLFPVACRRDAAQIDGVGIYYISFDVASSKKGKEAGTGYIEDLEYQLGRKKKGNIVNLLSAPNSARTEISNIGGAC